MSILVSVWVAVALVMGPGGPEVHVGPPLASKEECSALQAAVLQHPQVLAVSPCYLIEVPAPKGKPA